MVAVTMSKRTGKQKEDEVDGGPPTTTTTMDRLRIQQRLLTSFSTLSFLLLRALQLLFSSPLNPSVAYSSLSP